MSTMPQLYACCYVNEFPCQALLRTVPSLRKKPCVVLSGTAPSESVCSVNAKAKQLQIAPGMRRIELEAYPDVHLLQRSLDEEAAARNALHAAASVFSPRMADQSSDTALVFVLDIAGSLSMYGTPEQLAHGLLQQVLDLGMHARIAVSGNFHAAVCVAKGLATNHKVHIVASGTEAAALAPLPLSVLPLTQAEADTFALWGIRTLGALAALPETELVSRLGQGSKQLQQMARGVLPHHFKPVEHGIALEETLQFDTPVDLLESLLFGINLMLQQLLALARERIVALAAVTYTLTLDDKSTHTQTVRPALPTSDKALWLKLVQLQLEAHPPAAPVVTLHLAAEPGDTGKVQMGLFAPQLPEAGRLDVTLARIRAIVGEGNVGHAVLEDNHAPDSFRIEPFAVPSGSGAAAHTPPSAKLSLRQVRPPAQIPVTVQSSGEITAFRFRDGSYTVSHAFGPWLQSGQWWTADAWSIAQWDLIAQAQDGSHLCCCITHDRRHNMWQLVALYD